MIWAMALSLPPISSIAASPEGTEKCFESMYFTGLRDSMIHPGSGEIRSCCLGRRRTPVEKFLNTCGPVSYPPFLIRLPV